MRQMLQDLFLENISVIGNCNKKSSGNTLVSHYVKELIVDFSNTTNADDDLVERLYG
ncbi:hypothetical protein FD35_GL000356 [Furfurilactobacillus rossiae DSM 15814]|uniref:Uncharacterized protein n=1 Tax=Furfurilactobacillus rossiae DSM 15814 TaxID=1114972 RepID=A0A0R1RK55_9LACO|nr:hypothetical protein FD35_GL000356 [Furfurilactobacillus rossiae DSM 15814]